MFRILLFTCMTLLALACKKETTRFSNELAIDQRIIVTNAPADTVRMVVYSDGDWTMVTNDTASWATIQKGSGTGKDYAIVQLTNNTNLPRSAKFIFRAGSKTDSVQIRQRGLVPTIAITATSIQSPAAGGALQTPIDTNIPLAQLSVSYKYDANGTDWITGLQIVSSYLTFNIAGNGTMAARSAKFYISYLDVLGTTTKDSLTVNQLKP